jgi:hypothetical protein
MEYKRFNRLKMVLAGKDISNKRLAEIMYKNPAMINGFLMNHSLT